MTTNFNNQNQPLEPFRVQSNLLQNATPPPAGGPRRDGGAGKDGGNGDNPLFGSVAWNEARWLVMPLLAGIYWIADRDPLLRPITILLLLACLIFRMERRARQIAAVPLALAGLKLAYQMTPAAANFPGTQILMTEQAKAALVGLPWIPMFLAVCIFYLPQKATVTGSICRP